LKNITAIIITLNEEENIAKCINSAKKVCDEIIVVDSLSSDNTQEIAHSLGARVIEQEYLGDGPQKAFAEQLAKNKWILSLDADERLDTNAIEAILQLNLEENNCDAYSLKRKTFIGKNFIKLWYPDRLTRLYNRDKCGYSIEIGHAKVNAKNICKLEADLLHYSYKDYVQMVNNIAKFSNRGARMLYEKKKYAKWYDPMLHGTIIFLKKLILKGGMFHGRHGWTVSVISGFNTYMKYAMLLDLQEEENEKYK
jgi:glycosyltransferase involved in cell wall biosynthesis